MISIGDNILLFVVTALGALNGVPQWEDKVMEFDGCS